MPPTIIFKCPQFKWAPNNNIVPGARAPSHRHSQGSYTHLIEMLPMMKMSQKKIVFQFLASSRTTVINNSIDTGSLGPLNLICTNQFKWAAYNNI